MRDKKHSKHHIVARAQKRKKRNKQKWYRRFIEPLIARRKEARERISKELKKGLKKIEVVSKKKTEKEGKNERLSN